MAHVLLTGDFLGGGLSFDELDRRRRAGLMHRIRRGAYTRADAWPEDPVEQHLLLIDATVRQTPVAAVLSHGSAAVLHGLPVRNSDLTRVHLTRAGGGQGKVRRYVHLHQAPLPQGQVGEVAGLAVTSPARTVIDLVRSLPLAPAVAVGDAALRQGVSSSELSEVFATTSGWPGTVPGRRALGLLDARSESVGESTSRVRLWEAGIPTPELQHEVLDPRGRLVGRADFAWPELGTLGEFDGRIKYGRLLSPGQSVGDVVVAEKRREDALRDQGWQVVRWMWEDLDQPARLRERLERAFARGTSR